MDKAVSHLIAKDCTVLASEVRTSAFKVDADAVHGAVHAEGACIMVLAQEGLSLWLVLDNKVKRLLGLEVVSNPLGLNNGCNKLLEDADPAPV